MCIRDSLRVDRTGDRTAQRHRDRGIDQRLVRAGVAQLAHCLLYTSDAADEGSRVDLGGRRLIKKKKK